MQLNIFHMYPEQLNLYGDIGNIKCLKRRCTQRNIETEIYNFSDENKYDLNMGDIFFIGGGSDRSQQLVYKDFLEYKTIFKDLIENNKVVLAVCGGYQLLGRKFIDKNGNEIPGLGILDYESKYLTDKRIIGNIILESTLDLEPNKIVGFENHGGRTFSKYQPLGKVLVGKGNNDTDMVEGIVYHNYIGTYLHGPILPKNPQLADYLILKALQNKYGDVEELNKLDDEIEHQAYQKAIRIMMNK